MKQPGAKLPVLVDGPYGGIDNQKYFGSDRLVVVAGGVGAGWSLPFVEQYLRFLLSLASTDSSSTGSEREKCALNSPSPRSIAYGPRYLRIILATRDTATRTWVSSGSGNLVV